MPFLPPPPPPPPPLCNVRTAARLLSFLISEIISKREAREFFFFSIYGCFVPLFLYYLVSIFSWRFSIFWRQVRNESGLVSQCATWHSFNNFRTFLFLFSLFLEKILSKSPLASGHDAALLSVVLVLLLLL
jgi:hypothetical protein